MAAFSYNYSSDESHSSQYRKYLQNQNYVNQIDNAIRETGEMNATVVAIQTREVQNAIQVSSERQREAIIQASDAVCSTLESGFSDLNYNLVDIKDEISALSNLVGHGFSLIVEGQRITHQYLGQIQNLLRLPDSQKERVYHIEEGMKYLHNAFKQGAESDFYKDAFDEFNESRGGENKDVKDFISLYYIGLIHLKSLNPKLLNPQKAEICFRNSARYYLAEHSVGGTNFSNNLLQSNKKFIIGAVEAYLFAAEACYIQQKFSEAVELAAEAWKTLPEMTKAGLMLSKYLAANNQGSDAAIILEKVIRANRFISMEVLPDLDLTSKSEVINLLEELRIEAVQEAKIKFDLCNKIILPNSSATSYLKSIDELIKFGTFLEAKEATDMLLISRKWTVGSGANFNTHGQVIANISSQEFVGSVIDFVKFERERVLALPKATNLIRIEEIERQKQTIKNEISKFEESIKNAKSVLSDRWKYFLGTFWKVAIAACIYLSFGLYPGLLNGGAIVIITIPLMIVCGIATWLGIPWVIILLILYIHASAKTSMKNATPNSEISKRMATISQLNNEIRQLNNNILRLSEKTS